MHALKKMRQALSFDQGIPVRALGQRASERSLRTGAALLLGVALLACNKTVEKTEDVRPVRVVKLQAASIETASEYPGDVRPRIESRLGFRVAGKLLSRKVDVGNVVKHGQLLMQLDPQDLQLQQLQSQAALSAAQSNRDLALAELKRYQDLRNKNFVSQAVLDGKETAYKAAQSALEQAKAGLKVQSNQAGYASLVADTDGVVTSIDAEVGQVLAAGTPVIKIAQMGEKEVVIGIPENKVDQIRASRDVQVRLWANQDLIVAGKIREMSPVADPATRTYAAKITMINPPPEVRLGMTAYVSFVNKGNQSMIKVPLSALYQEKGVTSVWVVENDSVKLVPVVVAGPSGNEMLLAKGVNVGQTVVTAGVHLLKPGQKVKILADAASAPAASAGPMSGKTEAASAPASSAPSAAEKNGAAK